MGLFLYPLRTSKNQNFSDDFRGYIEREQRHEMCYQKHLWNEFYGAVAGCIPKVIVTIRFQRFTNWMEVAALRNLPCFIK